MKMIISIIVIRDQDGLSQVQFKVCMLYVHKAFEAFCKDGTLGNFRPWK